MAVAPPRYCSYNKSMNIVRLLIVVLIVVILYQLVRRFFHASEPNDEGEKQIRSGTMVRCKQCGLHIPSDEAVEGSGGYYCSEAHRQLSGDTRK